MNDYIRAATYRSPSRIPVSMGLLPATHRKYGPPLRALMARHPIIFGNIDPNAEIKYTQPASYNAGSFTDAWGCVWENISDGYESIVTGHPLKTREDIRALRAPEKDVGLPHGFMFLRLTDLRGFEEMMVDFAEEPPELQTLLDIVCEYNVRQTQIAVADAGEVVYFGDDNGMQHSLPMRPATWRKYLKPCYTAIFSVVREAGKLVYFHTDGCIYEVIPDMIECGTDILNPQIRANGLQNLVKTCKGKVCINLDLDRQLFPFATPAQIRDHILECTAAMYLPEGGLMLGAECAADVPLENIEAICAALEEASRYTA